MRTAFAASFMALALAAPSQSSAVGGDGPAGTVIEDLRISDDGAYALLSEWATRFGARPAGSASDHRAAAWLAGRLREMGFIDVGIERFSLELWSPGLSEVRIIGPEHQSLVAVPLGGLDAGPPVRARVATFESYRAFIDSPHDAVRGKIVAVLEPMRRAADGRGYMETVRIRYEGPGEAARRGAVGFVMRSLATHEDRFASSGATDLLKTPFPAFAISPPDAEQLARLAHAGPVEISLSSTAGWAGQGHSQNVVATLPGRNPSAPAILIGAHLDSWHEGTGSIDDGFGVAATIGALARIARVNARPRQTIKLVLFGAEEVTQPPPVNNFAGVRAYVARHREELQQIDLAAESDWGGGKVTRLRLPALADDDPDLLERFCHGLGPLGVEVSFEGGASGPPDAGVLKEAGARLFRLDQDATRLFDTHHNPNDTMAMVDHVALEQNVATWAITLWLLADRPQGQ